MKRKYIYLSVDGQIISRADTADIVGNTQNHLYAKFSLSEDWDGMVQTAVFSTNNGKHYGVLIEDGECMVPWEVLRGTEFWIGVFAGDRITSNTVRVPVLTSVRTNPTSGVTPTPTLVDQAIAAAGEAREAALFAAQTAADLSQMAENGELDGFSPTADVIPIAGGYRVTIADRDGEHTFDLVSGMTVEYDEETETLVITTSGAGGGEPSGGGGGTPGVGIASISQTVSSTVDNGINEWKITLTNGNTSVLRVRNGSKGGKGDPGANGLGVNSIRYNANTKKLEWVDTLSNIHAINTPAFYSKDDIDTMFGSYIDEVAAKIGGGA